MGLKLNTLPLKARRVGVIIYIYTYQKLRKNTKIFINIKYILYILYIIFGVTILSHRMIGSYFYWRLIALQVVMVSTVQQR